jgi:putative oxidoreductase
MIPERFSPAAYALFRIVFGALFVCHGLQKDFGMFGGLGGTAVPLMSRLGIAGGIEIVTGIMIVLGLLTRPAAFVACGQMAVAYFTVHHPMAPVPLQNGGEPAVLYCFAFLYIASRGAGIWSADAARHPARQSSRRRA